MRKAFEEKFLTMVKFDVRKIFNSDHSITENNYDAWVYINRIIDCVSDNASDWLLSELYTQRDYYLNKYLIAEGLVSFF